MDKSIDLVITYVDNLEPVWQSEYSKFVSGSSVRRYRQWENIRYWFRAVAENMPFIRKIHFVVSNIEQVPKWIDQNNVHIVLHKDIIPEQYLPTFNSTTIEMFLCKIEGLSEKFIYSNDDMFPNNTLTEEDFYENGLPIYQLIRRNAARNIFRMQCKNSYNLAATLTNTKFDNKNYYYIKHSMSPLLRSTSLEIWDNAEDKINWSISKFREPFNFTQYLFSVYNVMKKLCVIKNINFNYYTTNTIQFAANDIINKRYKLICINDCGDADFETCKQIIKDAFAKRYQTKSIYEV